MSSTIDPRLLGRLKYLIPYADRELITLREGNIVSQQYNHDLFFTELFEVDLKEDLELSYETHQDIFFLFFVLDGQIDFSYPDRTPIAEATRGYCYGIYNRKGIILDHLSPGTHRVFYLAVELGWMKKHRKEYPLFWDFIQDNIEAEHIYGQMGYCAVDAAFMKILRSLFRLDHRPDQRSNIELKVFARCIKLIALYHKCLSSTRTLSIRTQKQKVSEIKVHLDRNFKRKGVTNMNMFADRFHLSVRTIDRIFQADAKMTVTQYVEELRLGKSIELLKETSLSVKEISTRLGFSDPNYFIRVFRKKNNCTPEKYRRKL